MSGQASSEAVRDYLSGLQDRICEALETLDGDVGFRREEFAREGGGFSRPRVLEQGAVVEKSAVNFTHTTGKQLPAAASQRRPELAGRSYEAVSISLIVHPRNPYAPTCHANFRFFNAPPLDGESSEADPGWWFGGGFDLTPYYGFREDVLHWHRSARTACEPFGSQLYAEYKANCDEYFYLPHREEARGVGGLFFDDLCEGGFDRCFSLVQSISAAFLEAYIPVLERRANTPYGEREREFQLYRRGRYVEFNLLQDRGTRFGLQAATRVESVLASLPPLVTWRYDWQPEPDSPEAALYRDFLPVRDWLGEDGA